MTEKPEAPEQLIIKTCSRCGLVNESAVCVCGCAAMDRVEYTRADLARAPQEEPHLDFEQRQRATVIAESRGIDLETAQELVYLRDKALKLESLEEDNECLRDESQRRKEELDQIYGHALRGEPSPDDEAIAGRLLRPFDLPLVDYGELAALIASAIAAARSDAPAPQPLESETK